MYGEDSTSTTNRRRFLAGTAAATTAAIAGCLDIFGDDGNGEGENGGNGEENGNENGDEVDYGDPEQIIRDLHDQIAEGNIDGVDEFRHPDGTWPGIGEDESEWMQDAELEIRNLEVHETDDDQTALVEVDAVIIDDDGEWPNHGEYELRPHDEEWHVYSFSPIENNN